VNPSSRRIVVVGATSSIAEHCARLWLLEGPAHLVLLGRDMARLQRVAGDLRVRNPASAIDVATCDFLDVDAIERTVASICEAGLPDTVLIAHGTLPDQQECQQNLSVCRQALEVNGLSPVLFAEAFVARMDTPERRTLVLLGSVAGDRGRRSNYVYGAAKGLVTRYAQGLQHRLAGRSLKVVLVKPGPTATQMTAHLVDQGMALAPVEDVAGQIVKGAQRGQAVVYAPGKWMLIMMVIRHLPSFIFNRMNI